MWWKDVILGSYMYATLPYRIVANTRAARRGMAPLIVLFYHRIADDCLNPWTLKNSTFAAQIQWMQKHFDMVSLEEAQRRIRSGYNRRPAVSITFDDGYADNCEQALPLLIQRRIPCTYFVSTRPILEGQPFLHDVALGQPLRPNTIQQIQALARAGIEIGGHARTHTDLGQTRDLNHLHDEVVVAAKELAALLGRRVRYFAFPFGLPANLNPAVFQLAHQYGFQGVCSAYGGYNFPGDDPFHLQRIHGDSQLIRLKNWLTIDPRKLAVQRFLYDGCTHGRDNHVGQETTACSA